MIDPKTLHIGSTVSIGGKMHRIVAIDALNGQIGINAYTTDAKGVKHPFGYKIEDVEPIPITEELLTELGFEKRESGSFAKEYAPDSWVFITLYATRELCKVGIYPADSIKEASGVLSCYLHELESFLYLTIKTELIKE